GCGHWALVIASGPNVNVPLSDPLGAASHVPVARLQSSRIVTRPSASSVIVYLSGASGRVVPISSADDANPRKRQAPARGEADASSGAGSRLPQASARSAHRATARTSVVYRPELRVIMAPPGPRGCRTGP